MLNQRLKELRNEKNFTLKFVAEQLNVTIRTICRYEDGSREPSISMLKNLCDFYDVSADYLIGRTDDY
jgi:transcriptional regulator with XRE-family HTH domain